MSVHPRRARRGTTLTEATIAVGLAAAVLTAIAQFAALAARQMRIWDQRAAAVREAGNLMEQMMARPWSGITDQAGGALELSRQCRRELPDARLRIHVVPVGDGARANRIEIQIDWCDALSRRRCEPVRLVAWRYQDEEAEP